MLFCEVFASNTGAVSVVDAEDYALVSQFNWSQNPRGHFVRNDHGKTVMLHRVIAERMGLDLSHFIDHINGNKIDNTRANLRPATNQQNQFNTCEQMNNTSGFKGVTWDKINERWLVRIRYRDENGNLKRKHLGSFLTAIEGALAYNSAARELHGEYARVNEI